MKSNEYRWCFIQKKSLFFTASEIWYGADSQAFATMESSSGDATGRRLSRNSLVKKSSHDVKPWCFSLGLHLNSRSKFGIACIASSPNQPWRGSSVTRSRTGKKLSPIVENTFEQCVDFVVEESSKSSSRSHRPVQDCVDGETNQTSFAVLWSCCHDVVN